MHPLWFLSKLRVKAAFRKVWRIVKTVKGALLTFMAVATISMGVLPSLFVPKLPENPMGKMFFHPAMLLAFAILTIISSNFKSPIAFSLAEVEFLFSGPFTRRQLLSYKLAVMTFGAFGFALLLLLMGRAFNLWWFAGFAGMWLLAMFVQLVAAVVGLAFDRIGAAATFWQRSVIITLVLVALVATWQSGALQPGLTMVERKEAMLESQSLRALAAPFIPFSQVILAKNLAEMLPWAGAAFALLLATVGAILRLDSNFLEASLTASQRRYELLERMKRSGGAGGFSLKGKAKVHVPLFPFVGGMGPIAWRQILQFVRTSGRMIFFFPAIGIFMAPMLMEDRFDNAQYALIPLGAISFMIAMFMINLLPIGLKSELDHLDTIKSLPIAPSAIAWGSTASAMVYPLVLQLCIFIVFAAVKSATMPMMWAMLAFLLPIDLLLVSSDSLVVLFFPSTRKIVPGDALAGAKLMCTMFLKGLLLALAALGAAAAAGLMFFIAGESYFALGAAAWLTLLIEAIALSACVALFFARFDPSSLSSEERE